MRMALILRLLEGMEEAPAPEEEIVADLICDNPRCIVQTEQELPQAFRCTNRERKIFRCVYCESKRILKGE